MTAKLKAALRAVGRGLREVLLFPFRVIWWILRGLGNALKSVAQVVGEILEAVVEALFSGLK